MIQRSGGSRRSFPGSGPAGSVSDGGRARGAPRTDEGEFANDDDDRNEEEGEEEPRSPPPLPSSFIFPVARETTTELEGGKEKDAHFDDGNGD